MGRLIGISLLLLFGGCLATPPIAYQMNNDEDPFRFALTSNPFTPPEHSFFNTPIYVHTAESPEKSIPEEPIEYTKLDEPEIQESETLEDEILFKPSTAHIVTLAEQTELLSPNQWVQNTALINWIDTGRRLNTSNISSAERQRRDQINRLNMPPQEQTQRQHQRFDYVDGSSSDWRWMHRGVDQLYAALPERRENTEVFLRDRKYRDDPKYRTLRANAAILLGREGNPAVANFLLELVKDTATPVNIRCAAAEVLGHMPAVTADDLIPLLDEVKERMVETTDRRTGETREQKNVGIIEIWAELLIAIAEKIAPWEHPCFLEPFYASISDIRLENAKIWRRKSQGQRPAGELPEQFLEIARIESNPPVRVEIIRTLGAWQVSNLFPILETDLRHRNVDVRHAAMHALADARIQEAIPIIRDQLRESNSTSRATAVSALRRLGAFDDVFTLVNDQDFRVRVEVAQAFAERRTPQSATFAQSYLSDSRAEVQLATVEAISGWSIDESGPMLLIAARSQFSNVRRRATDILAERGIAYSGFDPEDRPANQTMQYEELRYIFSDMVGVDPNLDLDAPARAAANDAPIRQVSAIVSEDSALTEVRRCLDDWQDRTLPPEQRQLIQRRLAAHGQRLLPLIDHLLTVEKRSIPESLDTVFAEIEPMFAEIERLRTGDLAAQQRAARELARWGSTNSPSKIAAKRIIDLAARHDDPTVLTALLGALRNADSETVCELARPLLKSESIAVRRLACEMLAQFGSSEDVALLRETLRDPNREVVRGALRAVDALLTNSATQSPALVDASIIEALNAMLLQGDPILQTDVAATLHRLGRSEGTDALRRLAASNDNRVKIYVVRTISELEDSAFVPLLLGFLDDGNGSIRSEALKGLPRAAGEDIGRAGLSAHSPAPPTQQQIDRWKAWGRERR